MDRYKMDVSGGCQCRAVRYHATEMLDNSHICHCRMCQKAVGNIFAALVAAPREAITWTRGEPARFRSSDHVDRGFCRNCGTPLFYEDDFGLAMRFPDGAMAPCGQTSTHRWQPTHCFPFSAGWRWSFRRMA